MRLTKVILTSVLYVLILVSCSVQHTALTSKVMNISPEVIQMPTVAELDIAKEQVTVDTVVVMKPFDKNSGYRSRGSIKDALVASILKQSDADILMQPEISTEVSYKGLTSTLKMSLNGYPAKYSGFRTITMEDVEILNELKGRKQVGNISLTNFLRTDVGKTLRMTGDALAVSDPANLQTKASKVEKVRWSRPTGYKGLYEFEYSSSIERMGGMNVGLTTTQGVQMTPCFYLGGGLGVNYYEFDPTYSDYISSLWVPVFARMRIHFWNRKVAPYFDLMLGATVSLVLDDHSSDNLEGYDMTYPTVGTGFGLSFGRFSVGYNYELGMWADQDFFEEAAWGVFKFKLGLTF